MHKVTMQSRYRVWDAGRDERETPSLFPVDKVKSVGNRRYGRVDGTAGSGRPAVQANRHNRIRKSDIIALHRMDQGTPGQAGYSVRSDEQQKRLLQSWNEVTERWTAREGGYLPLEGGKLKQSGFGSVGCVLPDHSSRRGVLKKAFSPRGIGQRALRHEIRILEELDHPNIVKKLQKRPSVTREVSMHEAESPRLSLNDEGSSLDALLKGNAARQQGDRKGSADTSAGSRESIRASSCNPAGSTDKLQTGSFEPLPLPLIRKIAQQLASALEYLHNEKQMVHLDIKPSNIFIKPDGQVTLCDFGTAVWFADPEGYSMHGYGTKSYMAPEHLREYVFECKTAAIAPGRDSCARDSWSLGFSLYETAFGSQVAMRDACENAWCRSWEEKESARSFLDQKITSISKR